MGEKKMMRKIHEDSGNGSQRDTVLHPDNEVWKPDRMNPVLSTLNDEDKKTFYLFRNVTSILNKLTPENFTKLSEKMKKLPVDTSARMQGVVDIIHKKAINELKFCGLYAKLCNVLRDITVVDEKGITKCFSIFLISCCEKYFENSLVEDLRFNREKARINLCLDWTKKRILLQEYELDEYMFRKLSVGNCRFIGELFKLCIISPNIIFSMLDKFFKHEGIMSLECSCELIRTIGKFYEEKFGAMPQLYFENIEKLTQREELPLRIRFLLQDILDLKKNSWYTKIQSEIPKTFQQIEQEMREEENTIKLALAKYSNNSKDDKKANYRINNCSKSLSCDSSSSTYYLRSSKRWLKPKELLEISKNLFQDYVQHGDLKATVNSFISQFVTNQIPKTIFTLIKYVIENDSQNAGKCGELLIGLLEHPNISPQNIVKGLSLLLSTSSDRNISANLEPILGPLFLGNYLELDDLAVIFEENRSGKSSKTKRNQVETRTDSLEEIETFVEKELNNDSAEIPKSGDESYSKRETFVADFNSPDKSNKNRMSSSENELDSISSPVPMSTDNAQDTEDIHSSNPDSEETDDVSCLEGTENENCVGLMNFDISVRPAPGSLRLIYDLFINMTPLSYKKYSSKLKTFPFKRSDHLHYAASCIMHMAFKHPYWCEFYAEVCARIQYSFSREVETLLFNQWKSYFQTMYEEKRNMNSKDKNCEADATAEGEKQNSTSFRKNKMIGLCRFTVGLSNLKLIDEKTVLWYMKKLLNINDLESFCEMYENADSTLRRVVRKKYNSNILRSLADDNLSASIRSRLENILCHAVTEEKLFPNSRAVENRLHSREVDLSYSDPSIIKLSSCNSIAPSSDVESSAGNSKVVDSMLQPVTYAEHMKLKEEIEKLRQLEKRNHEKLQQQTQLLNAVHELVDEIFHLVNGDTVF